MVEMPYGWGISCGIIEITKWRRFNRCAFVPLYRPKERLRRSLDLLCLLRQFLPACQNENPLEFRGIRRSLEVGTRTVVRPDGSASLC